VARNKFLPVFFAAACCFISLGCNDETVDLYGAGATFPAPLYKRWFLEYYKLHPEVRVNYQAIGSGAGIRQFTANLVTFGASDAAMSDKEIEKANEQNPQRHGVLLLPVTAGSVALCYNLPGNPPNLKLSRSVYVDIFLGKITSWDDPAIAHLNPDVQLPDIPIAIVRRAEGSGTTYAFTNHLSAISPEWKERIGVGKTVSWPVGIGGNGNAGVAAWIQQTPGAIGYLEYGYAELCGLPLAQLENKAGRYVLPSMESGQAALAGVSLPADLRPWIPDPPGPGAYPIVTYTWLLCFKDYTDSPEKGTALKEVIRFGLTVGQQYSPELGYIPLPRDVAARVLQAVEQIRPLRRTS
jgi:phosphate transport system substrate-binding protein